MDEAPAGSDPTAPERELTLYGRRFELGPPINSAFVLLWSERTRDGSVVTAHIRLVRCRHA